MYQLQVSRPHSCSEGISSNGHRLSGHGDDAGCYISKTTDSAPSRDHVSLANVFRQNAAQRSEEQDRERVRPSKTPLDLDQGSSATSASAVTQLMSKGWQLGITSTLSTMVFKR